MPQRQGEDDELNLTRPDVPPIVVALGVAETGLDDLGAFFAHTPVETGLAFVVVPHRPPSSPSLFSTWLKVQTEMPVVEIAESVLIQANHVYLAGEKPIIVLNGRLHPLDGSTAPPPAPIDFFLRSLAQEKREHAVAVVLSGTGSDGAVGSREVRAHLGLSLVQEALGARTGAGAHGLSTCDAPDMVLSPAAMPARIVAYVQAAARTQSEDPSLFDPLMKDDALDHVLELLRARTGHDFGPYKRSTLRRRVARRMNVQHCQSIRDYERRLESDPPELDALFEELLIGVTSFFRDPAAFESLKLHVHRLLEDKAGGGTIRVWVAGCSTGEEAYSLAILFRECMEERKLVRPVQIFATDLAPKAIETARVGIYGAGIASDVSPERLARYFVEDGGQYRVRKEIRELLVFATHNLIEDPPFTKVDLLSCRNLLIYLDAPMQRRLLPTFHYALRASGTLFLGTSETIGTFTGLFDALDKKWRIFRRTASPRPASASALPAPRNVGVDTGPAWDPSTRRAETHTLSVTERVLLRELVPPTAIIRANGDIIHIHGRTGLFLEPAQGLQSVPNLFRMAREGLHLELLACVRQAAREHAVVRRGVRVRTNGHMSRVDLRVRRLTEPEAYRDLLIVSFELMEDFGEQGSTSPAAPLALPPNLAELERELMYAKETHQSVIEELETANEELTSTNEELQSTNEELQSANDELETSKEELQSLNEEMQTINHELHCKVEDLSRANDDMTNLLNATDVATLFLDNELKVKRHTEQMRRIIRLLPSDVGRPVSDLVAHLRYAALLDDARDVLRTLMFKEREVQGEDGTWYQLRIMPYRTTENLIDGLVITLVDITRTKEAQQNERRLVACIERSPVALFGQDPHLRFTWVCAPVFGKAESELLGRTDLEAFGSENAAVLRAFKDRVQAERRALRELVNLRLGGFERTYDLFAEPHFDASGRFEGLSCVSVDVTRAGQAP